MRPIAFIKRLPRWITIPFSIFLLCSVAFKGCAYNHHLGLIPKGMGVWLVTYTLEESWGFGPGGNETGVIAYALPEGTAERIEEGGIPYLATLKPEVMPNSRNRWRGIYEEWKATPMDAKWVNGKANLEYVGGQDISGIELYLNQYGFGINVDSDVINEINTAIRNPGSFYAYGRTGIIIVAPKVHKVFFVYSG